jgi:hypothetical protein
VDLPRSQKITKDNELRNKNKVLEAEVRQLTREVQKHDQLYLKFKDLKLDYKQMLDSFERSEKIRREQKQVILD